MTGGLPLGNGKGSLRVTRRNGDGPASLVRWTADGHGVPDVARRVRLARLEAGLTQATLAGGEISPITVSRIERGVVTPSRRVLLYIAERTGKPLRYFVDDEMPEVDPLDVDYALIRARLGALRGDWRRAEQVFAQAAEAAASLGDEARAAVAAVGRATALVRQGWTEAREQALREAWTRAERAGHHDVVVWSRLELASVLVDLGRSAEALGEVRGVLEGRRPPGDAARSHLLRAAALVALIAERTRDAALAEEAATLLQSLDGPENVSAVADLEAQAEDAYARGSVREAVDRAREACRLRSDLAARFAAAEVHYHLAQHYRDRGKYGLALESLLRARALWQGLGDAVAHAQALTSLADTYTAMGLLDDAATALDDARRLLAHAARQAHPAVPVSPSPRRPGGSVPPLDGGSCHPPAARDTPPPASRPPVPDGRV